MGKVLRVVIGVGIAVFGAVTGQFYLVGVGLSAAGSALTSPKGKMRQASATTVQLGEAPRQALFGRAATSGSLVDVFNYGGKYGTDWEVMVLALADHRCDALEGFYVNDQYVAFAGDGAVAGYNGQLSVWWRPGTETQSVPAVLTANGPGWTADDNGAGVCHVTVAYKSDDAEAKNPVWPGGRPRFIWVLRGLLTYDARADSSVGGSGLQRWGDPATRAWSENPITNRYTWARGLYACDRVGQADQLLIGRGLSAIEAPPANVFHRANLCDEDVGGAARYRVGGIVDASVPFIDVESEFAAACAGTIVQPEGSVEIDPGEARAAVVTITDDDLVVGSKVTWNNFMLGAASKEWVNTVVARYVEPALKWADHAAPVRRIVADVLADRQPREERIDLGFVTHAAQAGRVAEIRRRLGRLWGRAEITLPPRFAYLEEGDWIVWQSSRRFGASALTFRIEAWGSTANWHHRVALRQMSATVYSDVAPLSDGSVAIVASPPPAIGAPAAGAWAVVAGYQAAGDIQTPVLVVTGDREDRSARFVRIEYAATGQPWSEAGVFGPDVERVEIPAAAGGAYQVGVSYIVDGITGDRRVLGPVTAGPMRRADGTGVGASIDAKTKTFPLSATAPATPGVGDIWPDTSIVPPALKRWNGTGWDQVATTGARAGSGAGDTTLINVLTGGPLTVPIIDTAQGISAGIVNQAPAATATTLIGGFPTEGAKLATVSAYATTGDNLVFNSGILVDTTNWTLGTGTARGAGSAGDPAPFVFTTTTNDLLYLQQTTKRPVPTSGRLFISAWTRVTNPAGSGGGYTIIGVVFYDAGGTQIAEQRIYPDGWTANVWKQETFAYNGSPYMTVPAGAASFTFFVIAYSSSGYAPGYFKLTSLRIAPTQIAADVTQLDPKVISIENGATASDNLIRNGALAYVDDTLLSLSPTAGGQVTRIAAAAGDPGKNLIRAYGGDKGGIGYAPNCYAGLYRTPTVLPSDGMAVSAGETLYLSMSVRHHGTVFPIGWSVALYDATGAAVAGPAPTSLNYTYATGDLDTWKLHEASLVVPAGAAFALATMGCSNLGTTAQYVDLTAFRVAKTQRSATLGARAGSGPGDTTLINAITGGPLIVSVIDTSQGISAGIVGQAATATNSDYGAVTGLLKPFTYRVGAVGNSATPPTGFLAGLRLADNTVISNANARSYTACWRNRSTGAWSARSFDVYGDGFTNYGFGTGANSNSAGMAAYLNAIPAGSTVVIYTADEPRQLRETGSLPDAMYRCGATRSRFLGRWHHRAAYILVGTAGAGEGSGTEYFADGDADNSPLSYVEAQFTITNGIVETSGRGISSAAELMFPSGIWVGDREPLEAGSDVTQLILGPAAATVAREYGTGAPKAGELPRTFNFKLTRAGTDVTATATWSSGPAAGSPTSTSSMNATGTLTVTAAADGAVVQVTGTYAGKVSKVQLALDSKFDPPPASGGGSGSGTTATTSTIATMSSASYGAANTMVLQAAAGAAGKVDLTFPGSFRRASNGASEAYGKWQWRAVGGTFADVAPEIFCDATAEKTGGSEPSNSPGSAAVTMQKTGLTAGTTYEFQLLLRGTDATTVTWTGTATAAGS